MNLCSYHLVDTTNEMRLHDEACSQSAAGKTHSVAMKLCDSQHAMVLSALVLLYMRCACVMKACSQSHAGRTHASVMKLCSSILRCSQHLIHLSNEVHMHDESMQPVNHWQDTRRCHEAM